MTFTRKLLSMLALFLFGSLACSALGSSPSALPTPTALPPPIPTPATTLPIPAGLEIVQVASVIDGDTIELADGRRVRYIGLNTPERGQPYYDEAKTANERLVAGLRVGLERDLESYDQYGRILAYVWVNGQMANLALLKEGFANTFTIQPNVRYVTEFRVAEAEARDAQRGLWVEAAVPLKIVEINANAPGSDRDNPNGEWIEIVNRGTQPVSLSGYTLKDEANHIYTFNRFDVSPGESFRLYSGQGQDTATELYWGLVGESVWNNDTDVAFLRDVSGALVDMYAY